MRSSWAADELVRLHEEEFPDMGKVACKRIAVPAASGSAQQPAAPTYFVVRDSYRVGGELGGVDKLSGRCQA